METNQNIFIRENLNWFVGSSPKTDGHVQPRRPSHLSLHTSQITFRRSPISRHDRLGRTRSQSGSAKPHACRFHIPSEHVRHRRDPRELLVLENKLQRPFRNDERIRDGNGQPDRLNAPANLHDNVPNGSIYGGSALACQVFPNEGRVNPSF